MKISKCNRFYSENTYFCIVLHYFTKTKAVYSAIFTLKKPFQCVIMPNVVTKGYKPVIFSYIFEINIIDINNERQKIFYDKKQI